MWKGIDKLPEENGRWIAINFNHLIAAPRVIAVRWEDQGKTKGVSPPNEPGFYDDMDRYWGKHFPRECTWASM